MDSSFTIKPRPAVSPRAHALRDPVTVREAVDTELDAGKAVAPSTDGGASHQNPHDGPHDETSGRDVVIDPNAREALYNAIDVRAGHDEQSPNQALMRRRAYQQQPRPESHPQNSEIADPDRDPHADIEA